MKRLAVATLVLGSIVWGCASSERPRGAGGGSGGTEDTGGSGSGGKGTGGASNTGGGSATGGAPGTVGGASSTGGASGGKDASADASGGTTSDGPAMSGGDQWAKCGPEAYKADVTAADFCARYISVCKASVSMDACMTQYNGLSDGPRRCRACTAYYACLAGSAEVMAMSCMYVQQGLAKAGPCKPSYCD